VIYINWVRTLGSPLDLALDLGYRTDPSPPSSFPIRAVMSWEQAKVLRLLLDSAIESYEAEIAPIRELEGEVTEAHAPDQSSPTEEDS
jgi:hypothetical protein